MNSKTSYIHAVIIDYDGTLVDSMKVWHDLQHDMAWLANAKLSASELEYLNSCTLSQIVHFFRETYGIGKSEYSLFCDAQNQLLSYYLSSVPLKQGALALLATLHDAGVPLAVVSAAPQFLLEQSMQHLDIRDYFDMVISADDARASKRDPGFLREVVHVLNAEPSKTWCIDDSAYALKTMKSLGFKTIGIYDSDVAGTPEKLKSCSDFLIKELTEIDGQSLLSGARPVKDRTSRLIACPAMA